MLGSRYRDLAWQIGYDWQFVVGWASAGMTLKGNNPGAPDSFSKDHTADGWVIGTGAEYRLTHNVSLGLEYSFIDSGKDNVFGTTAATCRMSSPALTRRSRA